MPKANHGGASNAWEETPEEGVSLVTSVIVPQETEEAPRVKRAYRKRDAVPDPKTAPDQEPQPPADTDLGTGGA